MEFKYFVESPWTDRHPVGVDEKGKKKLPKVYPLMTVEIEELQHPTVTVNHELGRTVKATVVTIKGNRHTDHAVCVPQDKYDFRVGAKKALKRAMAKGNFTKETRGSVWAGFQHYLGF